MASLLGSLFVDQSIDRNDMIQLLRAAGSDNGVVDATEVADLKYLLANAVAYAVPDYVRHLASDIVNGNRANATFLGQTLGNLVAGSSETQLNKLIDKWFRGADHPVTSYTYQSFAGSLFVNGPAYDDSDQGYLGDCYFIAAMDAIADSSPVSIQNMFVDNGDNTWTVRFYVNGVADYVSVDRYLPTNSNFAIYAGVGGTYTDSSNELWMALAEKAYTQWNETGNAGRDGRNAYASIEGGWMQAVSQQVLGKAAQAYWSLNDSDKQHLVAAVNANKAVTYGTKSNPGNGMVGPHAYMVTSYNASTDKFQLYNPWGSSHPGPLTYAQLRTSGQCFVVADPAGSAAVSSGVSERPGRHEPAGRQRRAARFLVKGHRGAVRPSAAGRASCPCGERSVVGRGDEDRRQIAAHRPNHTCPNGGWLRSGNSRQVVCRTGLSEWFARGLSASLMRTRRVGSSRIIPPNQGSVFPRLGDGFQRSPFGFREP